MSPPDKTAYVRVVVRITKPCYEPATEDVRIVASDKKNFRKWKVDETIKTDFIGINEFLLEIGLPANTVLWFKLLVLRAWDREILHVEDFVRALKLGTSPVMMEMNYNDPTVRMRKMMSSIKTGMPYNLHVQTLNLGKYEPKPAGWEMDRDKYAEEDYHKAEYSAVDGKLLCRVRSPPKIKKIDCKHRKIDDKAGETTEKVETKKEEAVQAARKNEIVKTVHMKADAEKERCSLRKVENKNKVGKEDECKQGVSSASSRSATPSDIVDVNCNFDVEFSADRGENKKLPASASARSKVQDEAKVLTKAEENWQVRAEEDLHENAKLKNAAKIKPIVKSVSEEIIKVSKQDTEAAREHKSKSQRKQDYVPTSEQPLRPNLCFCICHLQLPQTDDEKLWETKKRLELTRATHEADQNNSELLRRLKKAEPTHASRKTDHNNNYLPKKREEKNQFADSQMKKEGDKFSSVKECLKFAVPVTGFAGLIGGAIGAFGAYVLFKTK